MNCIAFHATHQPSFSTSIAYHIFLELSNYILHVFLNYYSRTTPLFLLRLYQTITTPYALFPREMQESGTELAKMFETGINQ